MGHVVCAGAWIQFMIHDWFVLAKDQEAKPIPFKLPDGQIMNLQPAVKGPEDSQINSEATAKRLLCLTCSVNIMGGTPATAVTYTEACAAAVVHWCGAYPQTATPRGSYELLTSTLTTPFRHSVCKRAAQRMCFLIACSALCTVQLLAGSEHAQLGAPFAAPLTPAHV